MTASSVNVNDYRDTLWVRLIKAVADAGFVLGTVTGHEVSRRSLEEGYYGTNGFSLLRQDPRDPSKSYLFGLIKRKPRRRVVATIWIDDSLRKATKKSWVVETTGRDSLLEVTALVKRIAEPFKVKLTINLESDDQEYEALDSDYDM